MKYVERIKVFFLLKKFKKSIQENHILFSKLNQILNSKYDTSNIFNDETNEIEKTKFEDRQFDLLSDVLCDPHNIGIIKSILDLYYRIIQIDKEYQILPREFLSAWVISRFPKYVFNNGITKENIRIKLYSNTLIKHINNILNDNNYFDFNLIRFNLDTIHYKISFNIFMNIDKINKINLYSTEWISLEKSRQEIMSSNKYNPEEKTVILGYIDSDKKLIEKHMKILKSDFDYNKLKQFIFLSRLTEKKTIENYKKIIETELNKNNFDIIKKILTEIKTFIIIFNKSSQEEINEHIDIDYIIHLIKTKIITCDDITIFSDYIINKLKILASKSTEIDIDNKFKEIKSKYLDMTNINKSIAELLIYSMKIINIIREEIASYDTLVKLHL
jgi:hypothetical protein